MIDKVRDSILGIQTVSGYLFPVDQVLKNAEPERNRSVGIIDDGSILRVVFKADGKTGEALRRYIIERLTSDGIDVDPKTLTIKKPTSKRGRKNATAKTNSDDGSEDRNNHRDSGDADGSGGSV